MTCDYLSFNPSIILFKKRKGSRRAGKVSEIVKTRKRGSEYAFHFFVK